MIQQTQGKRRARYSHAIQDALRDQRRTQGEARNAAWAALTPAKKLADLDRRGVAATRQRAKLKAGGQ